jgi:heterodisulfide reductase subunit A
MLTLTMNGRELQAEPGMTLLEVAQQNRIHIPTLCHHKALAPAGLCRLCTVEVVDGRRRRLVTSCNYPVKEGLQVQTDTEAVIRGRKLVVELLLARCPDVPVLKELAKIYGIEKPRFKLEADDCIMCGLCARMCEQRMGVSAITLSGRGTDIRVDTPFQAKSEACRVCGACESVCPTGHIKVADITGLKPVPLLSEWDQGLTGRAPVYIPFPQAVPLKPVIDPKSCVHVRTGACEVCKEVCLANAINFDQEEEVIEIEVGSIIVATGYDQWDPTPITMYGYGRYPNVITGLEFERLVSAAGPTGGHIVTKEGREPKDVAILHCVGSRDKNYHEYCSRVCCMYALKFAHLIREKVKANVYLFYIDMRCFGKGYEEFYDRVQNEGAIFIRGKAAEVTDQAISPEEQGRLMVIGEDTLSAEVLRVPVDMVILAATMEPRADAEKVSRAFLLGRSRDGFFLEQHPKMAPVSTAAAGIFLAGTCQGPRDIPDTVAHASAAAAKALSLASRGKVEIESMISGIDAEVCAGCQTCVALCPAKAITFQERLGISRVNEALCLGCGSCAAACPSGAARLKGFTSEQVLAEIDALMGA